MNVLKSRLLSLAPVIALALGTTACGSDDTEEVAGSKQLEIFSWMTSDSERPALDALLNVVKKRVPGIEITNAAQDNSDTARDRLAKRMADNLPPDSFQLISGADVQDWIKKQALEPIDDVAASEGWTSSFPEAVLASARGADGKLYGVPLNTERDNTLFINKGVFEKHGVAAPKNFAEVMPAAEALKAKGVNAFSVPAKAGWTIASMVFESVFVAQAGPTFYNNYLLGKEKADAPEMRATLETVAKMLDYSEANRGARGWTDSVQAVCNQEAAMLILPDFVKGEFATRCGGEAISYIPMEGATPTFVFVGIVFPLAAGAPNRSMAVEFLKAVGSKEGQDAFNQKKGSIGVRNDLNRDSLDLISQGTYDAFKNSQALVPAYAALTSGAFQEQVNPALQKFCDPASADHKNVDTVLTVLRQAYSTLAR